jgi:hypothetical protein
MLGNRHDGMPKEEGVEQCSAKAKRKTPGGPCEMIT